MTLNDGFDRTVSDWLDAQAGRGAPGYLDEILTRTGRTRQRPAWSSLERWLPVQSIARFALVPRMAWLLVVLGLVLALGATAVFIGSRNREPLPPPFGMAGNGTVMYSATDGDIYALDTATNQSRPLIAGPTVDIYPALSPDGTKFVFNRRESVSGMTTTMVATSDGSDVRVLISGLAGPAAMEWSPAGDRMAVVGSVDGLRGLWIVGLNGENTMVRLEQPGTMDGILKEPHWLPNGQELLFLGGPIDTGAPTVALYRIRTDGTDLRTIIAPTVPGPVQTSLAPDGTKVAYSIRTSEGAELHVVDVDTAEDAMITFDGVPNDQRPQWSPDGRKLLFERYSGGTYQLAVGAVEGGAVVEIGPERPANSGGSEAQFSPDGTKVLAFYNSDGSSWILDPIDGSEIQLSDEIASPLTWQLVAP